jgi:signal transduction histidine kinase
MRQVDLGGLGTLAPAGGPVIPQLTAPPRVRVEWRIAAVRVLLAAGTLVALSLEPGTAVGVPGYLLAWYLIYSLALVAMVWTPNRFAPGWDIAIHVMDVAVFSLWILLPDHVTNPVVVYYVFVVVCATLRWQTAGLAWTAAAAIGAYIGISLYANDAGLIVLQLNAFASRIVHLVLVAALIGYLGTHQHRFQYEVSRLASWPRRPARDSRELISEILNQSSEFLGAPRTLLVWEEPGEEWINVAWQSAGELVWVQEPEATYGSFVLPGLEQATFQVQDAADERGRVLVMRAAEFRRRYGRPVHETLRARFNMRAVQSWPLKGEIIRGRLFCLDKPKMRLDDLVLGEVVAWLSVTRLESLYWQNRLRDAAAVDERVRLARDLHDSLLQSQAGAALQLVAARRLLDRDPAAGRDRLADVQQQLERDELEMRTFVSRLRPAGRTVTPAAPLSFSDRLQDLRQRVERQWDVNVRLRLDAAGGLPDEMFEGAYRLVQESIVNAARHADASVIDVSVTRMPDGLQLRIADDGRGFPFTGTFDLAALNGMNDGPLTLRERVADLGGDLRLTSTETGTELIIVLPLVPMHV